MSKEISKQMSKQLAKCPFCNEELEVHCTSRYYMHKLNGCIFQHYCFETDDVESIEKWNTRKPLERIVERLEEQAEQYNRRANELVQKSTEAGIHNKGKACSYEYAIEIVREEGGL